MHFVLISQISSNWFPLGEKVHRRCPHPRSGGCLADYIKAVVICNNSYWKLLSFSSFVSPPAFKAVAELLKNNDYKLSKQKPQIDQAEFDILELS